MIRTIEPLGAAPPSSENETAPPNALLRRETYGTGDAAAAGRLLPEIAMVGWARFSRAKPEGLGPHRHAGAWEICYLTHGAVEWWTESNGAQTVRRGDLFVTRPGETHGGVDTVMHPCALYWIIMDAPKENASGDDDAKALRDALSALATPRFPGSPACRDLLAGLLTEHRAFYRERTSQISTRDLLRPVAARALLQSLLVQVVRDYRAFAAAATAAEPARGSTLLAPSAAAYSPRVRRALAWMDARLHEPFCIEDAARAVGASPTRLHDAFLREVGATPADWRMRRRVDEAKARLSPPQGAFPSAASLLSITALAHELGFASAQHFATVFKRYTGRTPTEWRQTPPPAPPLSPFQPGQE